MISIKRLSDCPQDFLPKLAKLWRDEIGRHWVPDESLQYTEQRFSLHASREKLPIMYVAVDDNVPIGMACLRATEGVLPELTPWIGGLVVDPKYRKWRVVVRLINACVAQAKSLGYTTIYILAFDEELANKYQRIMDCVVISTEELHGEPVTVMSFNT
jgi:GNAT superfamily N-acetyltransferase